MRSSFVEQHSVRTLHSLSRRSCFQDLVCRTQHVKPQAVRTLADQKFRSSRTERVTWYAHAVIRYAAANRESRRRVTNRCKCCTTFVASLNGSVMTDNPPSKPCGLHVQASARQWTSHSQEVRRIDAFRPDSFPMCIVHVRMLAKRKSEFQERILSPTLETISPGFHNLQEYICEAFCRLIVLKLILRFHCNEIVCLRYSHFEVGLISVSSPSVVSH